MRQIVDIPIGGFASGETDFAALVTFPRPAIASSALSGAIEVTPGGTAMSIVSACRTGSMVEAQPVALIGCGTRFSSVSKSSIS